MSRNTGRLKAFLDSSKPDDARLIKLAGEHGLGVGVDRFYSGVTYPGLGYTCHLLNALGFQPAKKRFPNFTGEQLDDALLAVYSSYEEDILGYLSEERTEGIRKKSLAIRASSVVQDQRFRRDMAEEVILDWCRGVDISATAFLCELRDWGARSMFAFAREKDDNYTPAEDISSRFLADQKNRLLDYAINLSDNDISTLKKEVENRRRALRKEIRKIELFDGALLSLLEVVVSYRDQMSAGKSNRQ
jgi:hypothetical protein